MNFSIIEIHQTSRMYADIRVARVQKRSGFEPLSARCSSASAGSRVSREIHSLPGECLCCCWIIFLRVLVCLLALESRFVDVYDVLQLLSELTAVG